ncbi:MAG: hypothetical protein U0793_02785 [Gemmataceae bacterium]
MVIAAGKRNAAARSSMPARAAGDDRPSPVPGRPSLLRALIVPSAGRAGDIRRQQPPSRSPPEIIPVILATACSGMLVFDRSTLLEQGALARRHGPADQPAGRARPRKKGEQRWNKADRSADTIFSIYHSMFTRQNASCRSGAGAGLVLSCESIEVTSRHRSCRRSSEKRKMFHARPFLPSPRSIRQTMEGLEAQRRSG